MTEQEKQLAQSIDFYMDNYNVVFSYMQGFTENKIVKDPIDKVCRFCGKRYPEVKFKKKAHAISELVGNKEIILNNECDSCNNFFGRMLEDDFAKYLGVGRTLSQVNGKTGVPSFKSHDKLMRVDCTDRGTIVQEILGDQDKCKILDDNTISFSVTKDAYIPLAVFKSLVKMALSVMPFQYIKFFQDTIDWIREDNHASSKHKMTNYSSYVLQIFTPGPMPVVLSVKEFIRKNDSILGPFCIFVLSFANYTFQIMVPCGMKDKHLIDKEVEYYRVPLDIEVGPDYNQYIAKYGKSVVSTINFSSTEKKYNEEAKMSLHYDKCETSDGSGKTIDDIFEEEGISLKKRLKVKESNCE